MSNSPPLLPASGLAGFADLDAEGDASPYISFLDGFQQRFADMIETGIDQLRIPEGGAVLDVGCGHGAAFSRLAARTGPAGRICGIDASHALIDEARRRLPDGAPAIELQVGDAHTLPYPDATFDAVRADRVLVFLRDPRTALTELRRVCKPRGRLVVTEGDIGSAVVDAADIATTRAMLAAACDAIPQGWIGRRLRGLFLACGVQTVEVRMFNLQSTSFDEWSRRIGIEPVVRRAGSDAARAWLDDLRERDAAGRFYAAGSFFMASGTV